MYFHMVIKQYNEDNCVRLGGPLIIETEAGDKELVGVTSWAIPVLLLTFKNIFEQD